MIFEINSHKNLFHMLNIMSSLKWNPVLVYISQANVCIRKNFQSMVIVNCIIIIMHIYIIMAWNVIVMTTLIAKIWSDFGSNTLISYLAVL